MEDTTSIHGLAATLREYVNTRVDIVKLKAAEKTSLIISNLITGMVVAIVFSFFLVFISIASALALSAWIGQAWSGFLIMSGIFLLTGWMIWLSRERLIRMPVMNTIIHQLFKEEEEGSEKN